VTYSYKLFSLKKDARELLKGLPANMRANGNQQMRKLRTTTPTIRVSLETDDKYQERIRKYLDRTFFENLFLSSAFFLQF
jgi:hypothetical protein